MNIFKTKTKETSLIEKFANEIGREVPIEHLENHFKSEKKQLKSDLSFIKLNKILSKLIDVDNDKVDALRMVSMYIESSGRDIDLPKLISFLKS